MGAVVARQSPLKMFVNSIFHLFQPPSICSPVVRPARDSRRLASYWGLRMTATFSAKSRGRCANSPASHSDREHKWAREPTIRTPSAVYPASTYIPRGHTQNERALGRFPWPLGQIGSREQERPTSLWDLHVYFERCGLRRRPAQGATDFRWFPRGWRRVHPARAYAFARRAAVCPMGHGGILGPSRSPEKPAFPTERANHGSHPNDSESGGNASRLAVGDGAQCGSRPYQTRWTRHGQRTYSITNVNGVLDRTSGTRAVLATGPQRC